MTFSDLRTSRKLALAFAAVIAAFAVASGATLVGLSTIETDVRAGARSEHASESAAAALTALVSEQNAVRGFVLGADPKFLADVDTSKAEFRRQAAKFRELTVTDEQRDRMSAVERLVSDWETASLSKQIEFARNPATRDQALKFVTGKRFAEIRKRIQEMLRVQDERLEQRNRELDNAIFAGRALLMGGGAVSIALAALMAWLLTRSIATPVTELTGVMKRLASGDNAVEVPATARRDEIGEMAGTVLTFKEAAIQKLQLEAAAVEQRSAAEALSAQSEATRAANVREQAMVVEAIAEGLDRLSAGDLTRRLNDPFPPAYEKLRSDFNAAMSQLQETMKVVASNAQAIRSGAGEISQAADDLSRRTEQQAASLEETAAALDEITATVKKTAEGALQARQVVSGAKQDAERSGEVMQQAVDAMTGIEQSSGQIGQIIGVIEEIAFQTNLLALNAGVEAARAGEAGRGFAVVASEVRALAQRSADAAREIKTLISTSGQQVDQGVRLVSQTEQALGRILQQIGEINGVVADIAASAQEQSTGLAEVNTAVNQMDQVTQQNAAMVEQSTAASHSLNQEVEQLSQLIGRFNVGGGAVVAAPAPRRASSGAVAALKTVGRGGAAAKAEAAGWEEF